MLGYTPAGSSFPKLGQDGRWHRWRRHGAQLAARRPCEHVGNARAPRLQRSRRLMISPSGEKKALRVHVVVLLLEKFPRLLAGHASRNNDLSSRVVDLLVAGATSHCKTCTNSKRVPLNPSGATHNELSSHRISSDNIHIKIMRAMFLFSLTTLAVAVPITRHQVDCSSVCVAVI